MLERSQQLRVLNLHWHMENGARPTRKGESLEGELVKEEREIQRS